MRTTSGDLAGLVEVLEPELPDLAGEILAAIREEVPEYDRPLKGEFGRGIRAGVQEALRRFVAQVGDPSAQRAGGDVYRALGRGEQRQGRSLDALQAAYRVGARLAWRRLSAAATAAGAPIEAQHALAEAIFAYIDELAAESVEGYAAAQSAIEGERQRRRQSLLALLLTDDADAGVLRRAGAEAGWQLPSRVAVIACAPAGAVARRVAARIGADPLHGLAGDVPVVVVSNPAGLDAGAVAAALGVRLGVGPAVALDQAPRSLDWATRALALPGPPVEAVVSADRLAELVVHGAPDVAAALAAQALAPLDAETAASRLRLADTLRAWLRHQGRRAAIAEDLGVHPQTVRYRVARLRELFGAALDDPDRRFELELALRAADNDRAAAR